MNTQISVGSRTGLVLALGGMAVLPTVAGAQEQGEYDWKVFVGGAYVIPIDDETIDGSTIEATNEFGYELGIEWKPLDRFGFELAYFDANPDVEVDGDKVGDIDFKPWNLTFNVHLIDRNAFNWYIGPTVSFIDWGNLNADDGSESIEVDSETGFGVSTGLAIGIGETFAIQIGLRYLDASAKEKGGSSDDEVGVDPLFASVGFAFRF